MTSNISSLALFANVLMFFIEFQFQVQINHENFQHFMPQARANYSNCFPILSSNTSGLASCISDSVLDPKYFLH